MHASELNFDVTVIQLNQSHINSCLRQLNYRSLIDDLLIVNLSHEVIGT